jgi:Winged helix DNA-binding domain
VAATRSVRDLALLRLVAQGVVGPRQGAPERVVQRLLCLQAQDYWSGVASVALRGGTGTEEVEHALNGGSVVRAWPLRGTLHLVAASDLGWLRDLLAARELAAAAGREARLGITAGLLDNAERIAVEVLSERGPSTRAVVNAAWRAGGIETVGERGYHLVWHLAHSGTLCFGPVRGGQQLLVLAEQWAPPPARDAGGDGRDDALEALARRYFDGHGPATPADLARWANLTVADTERAVAAARGQLSAITVDDLEYLLGPTTEDELADCRDQVEGVVVLPGFDEMIFGYRDRTPTLPDELSPAVFSHRNGNPVCTVVVGGRVVATWRRPPRHSSGAVKVVPLGTISERARRSAEEKASALVSRYREPAVARHPPS